MIEFLVAMLLMFLGGLACGIMWRWHVAWLFLICATVGIAAFIFLRDWSDFSLSALIAEPRAWLSWMVYLPLGIVLCGGPVVVGGAAGFVVRRVFLKKSPR